MGIPNRLYRLAKHKLSDTLADVKDRLDRSENTEEREEAIERKQASDLDRAIARTELDDGDPVAPVKKDPPATQPTPAARQTSLPQRTPAEIARGAGSSYSTMPGPSPSRSAPSVVDPLTYHYHQLGVESGSDFTAVQTAYNKLAARHASLAPGTTEDKRALDETRRRLDESYGVLRDALDATARRFDLLEFDRPASSS